MCFQQAKRAGLGWPGGSRPAGSPDLWSGPSARARAWNGHPGFRVREKASGWIQTGLDLIRGNHPMTTHLTTSSSETRPNFRINVLAVPKQLVDDHGQNIGIGNLRPLKHCP